MGRLICVFWKDCKVGTSLSRTMVNSTEFRTIEPLPIDRDNVVARSP